MTNVVFKATGGYRGASVFWKEMKMKMDQPAPGEYELTFPLLPGRGIYRIRVSGAPGEIWTASFEYGSIRHIFTGRIAVGMRGETGNIPVELV
jgi:hypothetical protein